MLHEEQLQSHRVVAPDRDAAMAMAIHSPSCGLSRADTRSKRNLSCTFCHRSGHDISSFSANMVFPSGGAIVQEDPDGERGLNPLEINVPPGRVTSGSDVKLSWQLMCLPRRWNRGAAPSALAPGGVASFTDSDWLKLKHMLGNSGSGFEDRLTGDSGASSHVTGDITLLYNIVDMRACPIGLPDGKISSAIKSGTTPLHDVVCDEEDVSDAEGTSDVEPRGADLGELRLVPGGADLPPTVEQPEDSSDLPGKVGMDPRGGNNEGASGGASSDGGQDGDSTDFSRGCCGQELGITSNGRA
ncbi:hypothetical protein LIER_38121 [Lithospermum erythrorhizon]|uniref:Uncharacterized protein n=1 Tax=Lithospermum erythrorhizon TaxID=34254 RepID=A0AAV3PZI6_LITER